MKTIVEPFRIRTVEPIRMIRDSEREHALVAADYNVFQIRARDVMIDLLTDSGTGALSTRQWAAMMTGDESYAGGDSYFELQQVVHDLTDYRHVFPVHQGRAAEHILFEVMATKGDTVPNNTHFDTTRANIEYRGATASDFPLAAAHEPSRRDPFKGNMDTAKLSAFLQGAAPGSVPLGMLTITNNTVGGQPVSMQNIRDVARLYREHGIPFFLDAARFAENAFLIRERDAKYSDVPLIQIVREMFSYADGCLISAKKDGLVNIGGILAMNNDALAEKVRNVLILREGFPTYGGLAGRDLAALAQGLREVLEEDYLVYRAASATYLNRSLREIGVPTVRPTGLHAVYVDARAFLPHIPPEELPGQTVCCELYRVGGIRAVEIGTFMFGGTDPVTGRPTPANLDLVRLCLPRRVYTQSHFDWVIEAFGELANNKERLTGYRIVEQPPFLRAFTSKLAPLGPTTNKTRMAAAVPYTTA